MKKTLFGFIAVILVASLAVSARQRGNEFDEDAQIARWERIAEQGDTAALHRLIEYYNDRVPLLLCDSVTPDGDFVLGDTVLCVEDSGVVVEDDSTCVIYETMVDYDTIAVALSDLEDVDNDDTIIAVYDPAEDYATRLYYWIARGLSIKDPVAIEVLRQRM